jgi:hypothetical protein
MNQDQQKALASILREIHTPAGAHALAQVITETITPNRLSLDVFNTFLPTRQLQPGDILVKKLNTYGGIKARTMVPGTNHLADQMTFPKENYTYQIDWLIAKVRYSLWELQRAELWSVDDLRKEMASTLIDELVARIFLLIGTTWTASNTPSNYLSTAALTETALESMVEQVLLKAGNVRAIVGTRAVLMPIYKFNGVFEHKTLADGTTSNPNAFAVNSILEQWKRTGRLTDFRGIPLVELPQIYKRTADGYNTPLLHSDEIHVIGDDAGEIILYGDVTTQEYTDDKTEPPEFAMSMWRGFGMVIDRPENIGIIKITS